MTSIWYVGLRKEHNFMLGLLMKHDVIERVLLDGGRAAGSLSDADADADVYSAAVWISYIMYMISNI